MSEANSVERGGIPPGPTKGLTFRHKKREANVHDVIDGVVYYGVYLDGDDWPAGLYQCSIEHWDDMARKAIDAGAQIFTFLRDNDAVSRPRMHDEYQQRH